MGQTFMALDRGEGRRPDLGRAPEQARRNDVLGHVETTRTGLGKAVIRGSGEGVIPSAQIGQRRAVGRRSVILGVQGGEQTHLALGAFEIHRLRMTTEGRRTRHILHQDDRIIGMAVEIRVQTLRRLDVESGTQMLVEQHFAFGKTIQRKLKATLDALRRFAEHRGRQASALTGSVVFQMKAAPTGGAFVARPERAFRHLHTGLAGTQDLGQPLRRDGFIGNGNIVSL